MTSTSLGKISYYLCLAIACLLLILATQMTWAGASPAAFDATLSNGRPYYKVTFEVAGETFTASIIRKADMRYVRNYLAGREAAKFPTGILARGQGVNKPWSWHFKPSTVRFTEISIESCDAQPSYVEDHIDAWLSEIRRYCPWGATIVSALECSSRRCTQLRPR